MSLRKPRSIDAAQRRPDGIAARIPLGRRLDGSIHYQSLTFAELNAANPIFVEDAVRLCPRQALRIES